MIRPQHVRLERIRAGSGRRPLLTVLIFGPEGTSALRRESSDFGKTGTSAPGHVWTAPWQEPSDVIAALVGCGHVSGLLMRQERPLALMLCADRVPIELLHLEVR